MNSEETFSSITYMCTELSAMQVLEDDCNYEDAQQLLEELNKKFDIYICTIKNIKE